MSRKKNPEVPVMSTKVALIAGGIGIGVVSGLTAGVVASAITSNDADVAKSLSDIQVMVSENSKQLEGLEGSTGSIDPDDLSKAISDSMDAREKKRRESLKKEKYKDFAKAPEEVEVEGEWLYGNKDARFTLYTFADTQCGYCQKFHGTPKDIVDASEGAINTQYHSMTIINEVSEPQAVAAECAGRIGGNQAYWVYLDELYGQATAATSADNMKELAGGIGLDENEFASCLGNKDVVAQVRSDNSSAKSQGVTGTPTTVIIDNKEGDTEMISGARGAGAFIQAIQGMVSDSETMPRRSDGEEKSSTLG